MTYYKCGNIHPTQNSNVVVDTASGSVANFQTPLAMPLPKTRFDFKATQEAGTPTPQSPKAISGVSAVNGVHCHKNIYQYDENRIAQAETSTQTTRAYYNLGFKNCTIAFSGSFKSGVTPDNTRLNIGKLNNGILTILTDFIKEGSVNDRVVTFGANDTAVIMFTAESTISFKTAIEKFDLQLEVGSQATDYEPYNGSTTLINLGGTYYGGYVSQDKNGKRELVVTHGYASYDLSQIPPNQTADGWDSWLIYRAERAENNPSSPVGKLCNCCPEYSYSGSQINRPHYYINTRAFVMYLAENTYRDGYLEYTYPLETHFTIDLTDGEPIKSFPGINNIFCDTGDTSLQFRKIQSTS